MPAPYRKHRRKRRIPQPEITPKYYSQSGEDLAVRKIFDIIGEGNRTCVEFGAFDGIWLSNTKLFRDAGWKSWLFDVKPRSPEVIEARIHPDNIDRVFDEHGVPEVIDLLSIDVDGMDLWIFDRLRRRARVVIIEFNPIIPAGHPVSTPFPGVTIRATGPNRYDPYFGASPSALRVVARRKGMDAVDLIGCNIVFVSDEESKNLPRFPATYAWSTAVRPEWKLAADMPWTRIC